MRAVIAGATGFLGRAVAELLRQDGVPILGIARTNSPGIIGADLSEAGAWQGVIADFAPTHIFHIAGSTEGDDAVLERANVSTARALVTALRDLRPWLLSVGSGSIYGDVEVARLPVREEYAPNPIGGYARSKFAQEQEVGRYSGPVCLIRLANLLGPLQSPRFMVGRLINEACELSTASKPGSVIKMGSLDATRDFVDVRDAAAAIYSLAQAGATGVYNVGSGTETPLREIVAMVRTACRGNWRIIEEADRGYSPIGRQALAIDKIHHATGWTPRYGIGETIRAMVDAAAGRNA